MHRTRFFGHGRGDPAMSRPGRAALLVEPDEMVPPLLYVVSREAARVNGMRFDANARAAGRPAGLVLHTRIPAVPE
jgi:hypothetical protein